MGSTNSTLTALKRLAPWAITVLALWYAFRGVDLTQVANHLGDITFGWCVASFLLTITSYLLRARRWQSLFPTRAIRFSAAVRVLILGFFMNNLLPARAGEFIRAHMGAKVTGERRTLVLATIASERLVDGLTISLMFALFSFGIGDPRIASKLMIVALAFAAAGISVVAALMARKQIFAFAAALNARFNHKVVSYTMSRAQLFLDGLSPLLTVHRLPMIIAWSLAIWGVELLAYWSIGRAFGAELTVPQAVLFLVAVNFASLIPAAPGGLGVIEAAGRTVLMSIGLSQEQAITIVVCQHLIQYVVVGLPGAFIMATWKKQIQELQSEPEIERSEAPVRG